MASNQILNDSLTWGDAVQVKQSAPQQFHPGEIGGVCGIEIIKSTEKAEQFCQKIGSKLYLVEFENGEAIDIPESFLIKIEC